MPAAPQLRLAIANLPRIFDSYYKTKLEQADVAIFKGDATNKKNKMLEAHAQVESELHQVILKYSMDHELDLVIDSGSNSLS